MEHNTHTRLELADLSNDEINDLFSLEPLRPNTANSFNNSSVLTDSQSFSKNLFNSENRSNIDESILNLFSTNNNCNVFNSCINDSGNETGNTQTDYDGIKVKQEIMNFEFNSDSTEKDKNFSLSSSIVKHELDESGISQFNTIFQEMHSDNLSSNLYHGNVSNLFLIDSTLIPKYSLALFPKSILQLYNNITAAHSEFSFVCALSAQLCNSFIPTECFINLKIALLLSILSCNSKPISILAIGTDTLSIHSILSEIGCTFAKRFICNRSNDYESVKFAKAEWIEAGPSLLAKNGVYYLGDISAIKPRVKDRILKEIEDQLICVNVKAANLTYELECAIWCYWDKNLIKLKENDKISMYKFLEVFGIPIAIDSIQNDSLLHGILGKSNFQASNNDFLVPISDLKEYIIQITNRNIPLAKETSDLLNQYFLTARARGRLTQKGFQIINRLAESVAKLTNHIEILPIDAISAIFIAEQSIQEIFGPDMFPSPKLKLEQPMNLVGECDEFIKKFTNWLIWFFSVFKDK